MLLFCLKKSPVKDPVWPRGSQIFMTFGTWRWWVRQLHATAAFTPRNVPDIHHFHWGLRRPHGRGAVGRNMSLKSPVTPSGIDPGTVRLVAQRLNHYVTPGSYCSVSSCKILFFLSWQISRYSLLIPTSTFWSTFSARNERVCHWSISSYKKHTRKKWNLVNNCIQIYTNFFRLMDSDKNFCRKLMKLS